ncbi:hypothetical protein TcasGA2_TC013672 [Tribolium castaneum]|uniref:Uncharacterized protein n=1 Tax=Tribolium castaneum TaxID=7070 RepID=D6WKE8_TRICA|nr:hypothetical protein TcasGA2_TC013672 [Tribolium castaneum]
MPCCRTNCIDIPFSRRAYIRQIQKSRSTKQQISPRRKIDCEDFYRSWFANLSLVSCESRIVLKIKECICRSIGRKRRVSPLSLSAKLRHKLNTRRHDLYRSINPFGTTPEEQIHSALLIISVVSAAMTDLGKIRNNRKYRRLRREQEALNGASLPTTAHIREHHTSTIALDSCVIEKQSKQEIFKHAEIITHNSPTYGQDAFTPNNEDTLQEFN